MARQFQDRKPIFEKFAANIEVKKSGMAGISEPGTGPAPGNFQNQPGARPGADPCSKPSLVMFRFRYDPLQNDMERSDDFQSFDLAILQWF